MTARKTADLSGIQPRQPVRPLRQPPPGTTPATAPASTGPPPSLLRGKTLEEIVAKWNSDLNVRSREFTRMANEVAVWDMVLMENSEKVRLHPFRVDRSNELI